MPEKHDAESLLRLRDKLHGQKEQFSQTWEDLSRVLLTRRSGFTSTQVPGDTRTEDLFDGTGMQSARSLANHLAFWLRQDGEDWAFIKPENEALMQVEEAVVWMERSRNRMFRAMRNPKARFRQATGETDLDLVVFGTGVMFIGESRDLTHLIYQSQHLKDIAVFFDEDGRPQGLFRDWSWRVRNLTNRFKTSEMHENVRKMIREGKLDEKVNLVHIVLPRPEGNPDALSAKKMPYAEYWLDRDNKHIMREGGFRDFPFVVPRWDTTSGEDYGRSPGMIALPDINTLQAMEETALISGQRVADPPLMAPNDGAMSAVNTFPGGITYYNPETAAMVNGNPFFPLISGANLPLTREMQMDKRTQVMSAFFRNILNLPTNGPQMTATEVMQRKEEFIRELGPVFGRFESDYTAPMVERTFNIMLRAGAFDPIPEILQGQNIRFEFESPVNKIREQVKAATARMWALETMEYAQVDPSVRHVPNFHELARFTAESANIPPSLVNSPEVVARISEQEAQKQEQTEQAVAMQQMVDMGERGAKALKTVEEAKTQAGGRAA